MRTLALVFAMGVACVLNAQMAAHEFAKVDDIALKMPHSVTTTVQGFAGYIHTNFISQTDKSRAIFTWITNNIEYNMMGRQSIVAYKDKIELAENVLQTRKGICMHYAELYNAVANMVGIKTYVVTGYTKNKGTVTGLSHAWCVSLIGSNWYFFDPTWGAGYVQDAKFIKKFNPQYFKTSPQQLLTSHMPFDPLWQMVHYPITYQEFNNGNTVMNTNRPFFNYEDSISKFEKQTKAERLVEACRRITANGIPNAQVQDRLNFYKKQIDTENKRAFVTMYNDAVKLYNGGIEHLNKLIYYRRNQQFAKAGLDTELYEMVNKVEKSLTGSKEKLKEIENSGTLTENTIQQLNSSIDKALMSLNEQKQALAYTQNRKNNKR